MTRAPDLIVIGAGAAGTCAALEAGRLGASVLVLEAAAQPGGAGALSSGGVFAVETDVQERHGVADSVASAVADWLAWGGPEVDEAWARRYVARAGPDVIAWAADAGVEWEALFGEEGNAADRWHRAAGGGAELLARLRAAAAELDVEWRCDATVAALLRAGEAAAGERNGDEAAAGRQAGGDGVPVERAGGEAGSPGAVVGVVLADGTELRAGAVVVATGGFAGSPEALARWAPRSSAVASLLCGGGPTAGGLGHALLADAGAAFADLERLWIYPFGVVDDRDPSGRVGVAVRTIDEEVWVNAHGRRFHDESRRGGATGAPAQLAQPGATCWAILDARSGAELTLTHPFYGGDSTPRRDRVEAYLERRAWRADTIAELADAVGLPREALVETIATYNGWLAEGRTVDPDFGRDLTGRRPITDGPFVAVPLRPLARKCLGGVLTDERCAVLDAAGVPIPGLFAAGEVAGMAGGAINGRAALEGTMLGPSLYSGRVAGAAAYHRDMAEDPRA